MALSGIGDCTLCIETFSEEIRSRCLPCGHTFCTNCIEKLVKGGSLICPTCKKIHICATGKEFPINYHLEETIIKGREMSLEISSMKRSTAIDDILKNKYAKKPMEAEELVTSQKYHSEYFLQRCITVQSDIGKYRKFLNEEKAKHLELLQKINKLANRNESVVERINEELSRLTSMSNNSHDYARRMDEKFQPLKAAKSLTSSISAISDLEEPYFELREWNNQCRQKLPDPEIMSMTDKVMNETKAVLSMVDLDNDEPPEVPDLSQSTMTILEKKNMIWGHMGYPTLNMENLKSIAETERNLLERGRVCTVQLRDGVVRSAKITTHNDRVYLHPLKEGGPPQRSLAIQHSELVEYVDAESAIAFLDFALYGITKGRVFIRLSSGTPYGQQFRILCTGDLGPSYVDSKLELFNKGALDECIVGGNYDGLGGLPLVEGLEMNLPIYRRPYLPGGVWANFYEARGSPSAKFGISTKHGARFNGVFGQVISGLGVVREIAQTTIKCIRISNCGAVIPI